MNNAPIGIFDSGIGGLTVLNALLKKLPCEEFVYLGDTAHLPYGNKTKEAVLGYARANSRFLLQKNIKLLVIACYTACAHALTELQKELSIPVIGVIEPGCEILLKTTRSKKVAILGTSGTIASRSVEKMLFSKDPSLVLFPQACPLFVPLVEERMHEHPSSHLIAHHYLSSLLEKNIDAALLACTHYPLLKPTIEAILGPKVSLIEPAEATATAVYNYLFKTAQLRTHADPPAHSFFVTEGPESFEKNSSLFFHREIVATLLEPLTFRALNR